MSNRIGFREPPLAEGSLNLPSFGPLFGMSVLKGTRKDWAAFRGVELEMIKRLDCGLSASRHLG